MSKRNYYSIIVMLYPLLILPVCYVNRRQFKNLTLITKFTPYNNTVNLNTFKKFMEINFNTYFCNKALTNLHKARKSAYYLLLKLDSYKLDTLI